MYSGLLRCASGIGTLRQCGLTIRMFEMLYCECKSYRVGVGFKISEKKMRCTILVTCRLDGLLRE